MVKIRVTASDDFEALPSQIMARVTYAQRTFYQALRAGIETEAKQQATRGRPGLIKRSGKLEGAIRGQLFGGEEFGDSAIISVGVSLAEVPYARIQELGGVIRAKRSRFLVIPVGNGEFRRVKQVTIPARPYLEPAVRLVAENLQARFDAALDSLGDL